MPIHMPHINSLASSRSPGALYTDEDDGNSAVQLHKMSWP